MARVGKSDKPLSIRLSPTEREVLAGIAEEYADLVEGFTGSDASQSADPALSRLFPDGYHDDADAAAEFRRFTHDDLAAGKLADARLVVEGLHGGGPLVIERSDARAWLRMLTGVRLVLAERLGIHEDGDDGDARPEALSAREIYAWLGSLQEHLIHRLDS